MLTFVIAFRCYLVAAVYLKVLENLTDYLFCRKRMYNSDNWSVCDLIFGTVPVSIEKAYISKKCCFDCRYSRLSKKRLFVTRIFSEIIAFRVK